MWGGNTSRSGIIRLLGAGVNHEKALVRTLFVTPVSSMYTVLLAVLMMYMYVFIYSLMHGEAFQSEL